MRRLIRDRIAFLHPKPKPLPRWIDSPDSFSSALIDSYGGHSGSVFVEQGLWVAVYADVRLGRFLSKASAQIGVANARGRQLMPDREIASEGFKERMNKRMRMGIL